MSPERTIKLKGSPLEIQSFGYPYVTMLENLLVVMNTRDDSVFKLYNPENLDLIYQFGSMGNGPYETRSPIIALKNNLDTLTIYESIHQTLYKYFLSEQKEILVDDTPLPRYPIDRANNVLYYTDSLYIYVANSNGRIIISNERTGVNTIVPYGPPTLNELSAEQLALFFNSESTFNSQKQIIASAPVALGQIDFFDLKGKLIKSVVYDDRNHSKDVLRQSELEDFFTEIYRFALDIYSTEDHIYLLVEDLLFSEIGITYEEKSRILKFDWEGNFLVEYQLDKHATSIAIDILRNKAYINNQYADDEFWAYDLDQ